MHPYFLRQIRTAALALCCAAAAPTQAATVPPASLPASNPFAAPSRLPYQLPPFGRIHDADFAPAFAAGMATQLREVHVIAANPAPPSFANTVLALERSGTLLNRVSKVFFNLTVSNSDAALEKLEQDVTPRLAAHSDAIQLDPRLFERLDQLHQRRDALGLDPESMQLLERDWKGMVRAGARLGEPEKARLREINQQLAAASTRFRQNVLKATQEAAVVVEDRQRLAGLDEAGIGALADAAKARGLDGKFLITLRNTTVQPLLGSLSDRTLREQLYRASIERGIGGNTDNRPVVAEMIRLRVERARLLGYATPAAYILEDDTAGTPSEVNRILGDIAPVAVAAARHDAGEIQALIDAQAQGTDKSFQLQPWDWDYYAGQVRKAHHDFNEDEIKPYFELDRVLIDGVFYAASRLYGLHFKERHDLKGYRDDVRVFEVRDADGSALGLFIADFFARDNKQGGAWMNTYVDQSSLLGDKPVVVNNLNIVKPPKGTPVLLSFDETTTLFHEFGHALHGLLSQVRYPSLSGINVPPDFGEYPSQYNEMWAREPEVLAHFARHYRTGKPLPKQLLDRVLAAQTFDAGFATTSYLAAAMLDQAWHQIGPEQVPDADHVMAFEDEALKKAGMDFAPVPVRYRSPYFVHIFSDGYEAGYYAYLWSEVLARDTGKWFHTHGGMTRANGDYLRAKILSRGRTEEPGQLFAEFYGAPPDVAPLLEYRGLQRP